MPQKSYPDELPPIEIDTSTDDTMEIVSINDDSATPVPRAGSGVRPVRPAATRPDTSPVATTPLEPKGDASGLSAAEKQVVEAIRQSLEKGAQVLRAVAQLCVEKKVFTPDDVRRKG
jgi:hypothetical protein